MRDFRFDLTESAAVTPASEYTSPNQCTPDDFLRGGNLESRYKAAINLEEKQRQAPHSRARDWRVTPRRNVTGSRDVGRKRFPDNTITLSAGEI